MGEVIGSALRHGVDPENIEPAFVHALAVDQVGVDPDDTSSTPSASADPSVDSWDQTERRTCSGWSSWTGRMVPPLSMPCRCGRSIDAHYPEGDESTMTPESNPRPTQDADVDQLADEAEHGYDVEQIIAPPRRTPPRGAVAGTVESVRLDPTSNATCCYAPRATTPASPTSSAARSVNTFTPVDPQADLLTSNA